MKKISLTFSLRASTHPGQSILIVGDIAELSLGNHSRAIPLQYQGDGLWTVRIDLDHRLPKSFSYNYILRQGDSGALEAEWISRKVKIKQREECHSFVDEWSSPSNLVYTFDTKIFDQVIPMKEGIKKRRVEEVCFCVQAPMVEAHQVVCILGGVSSLGSWNTQAPVLMERCSKQGWYANVPAQGLSSSAMIEYKYGLYDLEQSSFVSWEDGENRRVSSDLISVNTVVHDESYRRDLQGWWRGAGVAVPIFSLRTEQGLGVGEFRDIEQLVDWAVLSGIKLLQILPINDTTAHHNWLDSYPYAAVSVYALHPIYLHLQSLPYDIPKSIVRRMETERLRLNELPNQVDYEGVMSIKMDLAKAIFVKVQDDFLADKGFKKWFKKNKSWLVPYAAYCHFRDLFGTPDFAKWGRYSTYDAKIIKKLSRKKSDAYDSVAFVYFLQYHLHIQLVQAAEYAHSMGVAIKGDIPIGIYRYSCDAWVSLELYHMDMQAGAPPDDFSLRGQNWGFPTYNWERMAQDGYAWWRDRFQVLSQYFDSFRIDHILGFFRIWQVPITESEATLGHFCPALGFTTEELRSWGLDWDVPRFCNPYISRGIVESLFGVEAPEIIKNYLQPIEGGQYAFQDHVKNSSCIKRLHDAGDIPNEHFDRLQELATNVLFVETETEQGMLYHPRVLVYRTSSYMHLDEDARHILSKIYEHYFYERNEDFWEEEGMRKLPALKRSTDLLVCGEDLGMVPACVPSVMDRLNILSLQVQRMPSRPNQRYSLPSEAPYLSVVTSSSHDTSTLRGWWQEESMENRQYYYSHILGREGAAPEVCSTDISRAIINQHLHSPAMWCVLPMQDYLGLSEELQWEHPQEERINIPANIPHYWRWRMHVDLEDLIDEHEFCRGIKEMVSQSKRRI